MRGNDKIVHLFKNPDPKVVELDERETRFANHYVATLNAEAAARHAGMDTPGWMMLKRPRVWAKIREMLDAQNHADGVNAERALQELARLAYANPMDYLSPNLATGVLEVDLERVRANPRLGAAIQELKFELGQVKLKLYDKTKALDTLGKYLKIIVEKIALTDPDGNAMPQDVGDREIARRMAFLLASGLRQAKEKPADEFGDLV